MTDAPAPPAAHERVCPGCNKPFVTPYADKVTCSARCKQRQKNIRARDLWKRKKGHEQAVLVEIAPKALVPASVRKLAAAKMSVGERIDAYQELSARLFNSITDDVIDDMHGRDRVVALGIIDDKLEKLEAKPAPAVKSRDREKVMRLLERLEEQRRKRAGAIDAQATEVRS